MNQLVIYYAKKQHIEITGKHNTVKTCYTKTEKLNTLYYRNE